MKGMSDFIYHLFKSFGYRHPLHPALVHLPIGLNIGALLLSIAARSLRRPDLERSAYHALVLTCLFSFVALTMGLLDWQHYFNGAWLRPIKAKLFIAILYTALMVLGVVIGYLQGPQAKALLPIYTAGLLGVMSLGYLGGELTFSDRSPTAATALAEGQSPCAQSEARRWQSQSIMPAFTSNKLSDTDLAKLYDYIQHYLAKPDYAPPESPESH